MQIWPAIDLRGGKCVRLRQGDYNRETVFGDDPAAMARHWVDQGAECLHLVDLDGARDGHAGNGALIARLAALRAVKLQVGGGLRSRAAIAPLLATGVARAVVGSAALTDPGEVREWLAEFGAERIALAFDVRLDARGTPRVATHGWRRQSALCLWEAVEGFAARALKHVLCTDVRRDGALSGPNVALYREAAARFPEIAWQASGGVRDARDLAELEAAGAAAAISGKALLDELIPAEELRAFLPNA